MAAAPPSHSLPPTEEIAAPFVSHLEEEDTDDAGSPRQAEPPNSGVAEGAAVERVASFADASPSVASRAYSVHLSLEKACTDAAGPASLPRPLALPEPALKPAEQEARDLEKWKTRRKHIFILTSAGKPIFTRYGDESVFSELFGVFQVLISMVSTASGSGDRRDHLRRVVMGDKMICFSCIGELTYVMVTATQESTRSCMKQLRLLHNQMLAVIPNVNDVLLKTPGYDIRRLFALGDVNVMRHLIHRLNHVPAYYFRALHAAAIPADLRHDVEDIVIRNYAGEDHLYSVILYGNDIVTITAAPRQPLHPDDALLLINFANCVSLIQGEVWAPLCLPRFNDTGYLWCHVSYIGPEVVRSGTIGNPNPGRSPKHNSDSTSRGGSESDNLLLLVQLATGQEHFGALNTSAQQVKDELRTSGLAQQLEQCANNSLIPIDPKVCGTTDMQYFLYVDESSQIVQSAVPPQLADRRSRKRLYRLLLQLKDRAVQCTRTKEPQLFYSTSTENIIVEIHRGCEMYAVFLPSTTKVEMIAATSKLARFIKSEESNYFITKTSIWR